MQIFFRKLIYICTVISAIFPELSEYSIFFVQAIQVSYRSAPETLEGYYTYKPDFFCYNRLVSLQKHFYERKTKWQKEECWIFQ